MDLYAFEQKTIGAAEVGELLFANGHWRIKVSIPNKGNYLLNLTGELDSPLWRADDTFEDVCVGLADGFQWFPNSSATIGTQASPRHLSMVVTDQGPAIVAAVDGNYLFFSTAGNKVNPAKRGTLVFANWSVHLRDMRGTTTWPLVQIGPVAMNG